MMNAYRKALGTVAPEARLEEWCPGLLEVFTANPFGTPVPIIGSPYWAYRDALVAPAAGGMGFASVSDVIAEKTGGKGQWLDLFKVGTAGVVASSNSLWNVGTFPPAGGVAAAAPGGFAPTKATTGAQPFNNPTGGDTLHVLGTPGIQPTVNAMALLLYDRLWHGNQSLNATNVAWTGTPTRYLTSASPGNFFSLEVTTVMSATATNLTVTYVDQDGNTAEAATAVALTVSSAVNRIPLPTPRYSVALNGSDTGLRNVTNIQSSGANTGAANMFIGHPIAVFPCPLANFPAPLDLVNAYPSLPEVKTDACLAWIELQKSATTATTYQGGIELCSG